MFNNKARRSYPQVTWLVNAMKTGNYTKFGVWLSIISLIVALSALNPVRAKRIACKVAVFFELYDSMKECQYGCIGKSDKPSLKKKKIIKTEPKKIKNFKTSTACSEKGTSDLSLGIGGKEVLFFGFVHLILFLVLKVIVNSLKKLIG